MALALAALPAGGALAAEEAAAADGLAAELDAAKVEQVAAIAGDSRWDYWRVDDVAGSLALGLSYGNVGLSAADDGEGTTLFTAEWRPGVRAFAYDGEDFDFGVAPFVGAYVGADESYYGYAGFGLEFLIGDHFVIMPSTAVGGYHTGEGRNLGHGLEFRSGLELGYRWDSGMQASLAMHHLSNAGIGNRNPGTEHVTFFLTVPLGQPLF
jgi:hypothetical protein